MCQLSVLSRRVRHFPEVSSYSQTGNHSAVGAFACRPFIVRDRDGVSRIVDGACTIADDGPGIPAPDRERVLKRFVRLEASRSTPGSGLGLSLVAAIVELHGGRIELLDNHPGLKVAVILPAG